jgi:hypothetical protein
LKGSKTHHFGDSMGFAEFIVGPAKKGPTLAQPILLPGQAG